MSALVPGEPRVLIVTPYYREPRATLERCIASVAAQSVPTAHLLVADGHPVDWIGDHAVRHIALDRAHGNFGNTPRAIGLMAGIGEGYDAIGLLDADNWIDHDHVATCLATAQQFPSADYIIAQRRFCRVDGSVMPLADEPVEVHVDTSCFFFLPGSYAALPLWGTMPDGVSPMCDRIFYAAIRARGLVAACTGRTTVNFEVSLTHLYERLGEEPPERAKDGLDVAAIVLWLESLTPRERAIVERRAGVSLDIAPPGD